MNLESIRELVSSKMARQILITQKHSPKILFGAGVVGVVGATVLACRATLKLDETLKAGEDQIEREKALHAKVKGEAYSDQLLSKNIAKANFKTGMDVVKLYAPAVGLGVVSVAALTGSHVILSKRNTAVMAAYAAMDRAYKEYRERVRNEYGDEVDQKFSTTYGYTEIDVEEKTADGKTKTVKEKVLGKTGTSPYAALFDETSKFFSPEPGRNQMTLGMKQSWANDKLRAHGHLFLNEVYDMLGLPRTKAGAVVGWVWRREDEQKTGDNYVSFGVFENDPEIVTDLLDGSHDAGVWLDFNVDGVILDLI